MVRDRNEIFCDRTGRDMVIAFDLNREVIDGFPSPSRYELTLHRGTNLFSGTLFSAGRQVNPSVLTIRNTGTALAASVAVNNSYEPVFTTGPVTELFATLSRMLYIGPFRNTVNVGGSGDYYDIRIGQPFITSWRAQKTGYAKDASEGTYRLTEDIRRIFGFDKLDINASDDGQSLQLMIDGRSYKQTEVGSGLAQFIMVLVNAVARKPSYILIDEPELHLHPSLQADFLATLASYAEEGVLFATHSLGLARAVSTHIYSVRRTGRYGREVKDFNGTKDLAEFLGELGFNAYQDLGFETVLLVEGPTDVLCVQQLLRLYEKEHKIVLLPLGGRSMIHSNVERQLVEITRISQKVYALIDSERSSPDEELSAGRRGFVEACVKSNIVCRVLDRRATENYLPAHAVQSAKGDKYRQLDHFELLKDAAPAWGKEENWKIARYMVKDDLKGTDLGRFLEEL